MFNKPSSFIKCLIKYAFLFTILILLSILIINRNVIEVKLSETDYIKPLKTSSFESFSILFNATFNQVSEQVPFDQLLDLPIKFKFLIQPKTNCSTNTQLIIFVHSKIDNFKSRNEIRSTWGSIKLQENLNYRLVFLIGLNAKESELIEQEILKESKLNDDLVRGNFIDTYRNLTYKHVMGYKWILNFCTNAHLIMKCDDDAFINIFEIIDLLNLRSMNENNEMINYNSFNHTYTDLNHSYAEIKLYNLSENDKKNVKTIYNNQRSMLISYKKLMKNLPKNKFIACSLLPNGTQVKRNGKWRLTYEEYDLNYFPPYCSGITYFLNQNALRWIYVHAHQMNKILFIDDLFLTGIVIQQTNYLNYLNDSSALNEDDYFKAKDYDYSGLNKRLKNLENLNIDPNTFWIVDWSSFYNYRWKKFIRALTEQDNSFNSIFFINDLDRMPNRNKFVQIAWKKIKKIYQVP